MRRVIGMDLHRTFAEVVFWEEGRLRWHGRVDMTRSGLEGFGRSLTKTDEVVIEATGNTMAVVRVLRPYVARVIIANPLEVKPLLQPAEAGQLLWAQPAGPAVRARLRSAWPDQQDRSGARAGASG
jgi:hypothetical protein